MVPLVDAIDLINSDDGAFVEHQQLGILELGAVDGASIEPLHRDDVACALIDLVLIEIELRRRSIGIARIWQRAPGHQRHGGRQRIPIVGQPQSIGTDRQACLSGGGARHRGGPRIVQRTLAFGREGRWTDIAGKAGARLADRNGRSRSNRRGCTGPSGRRRGRLADEADAAAITAPTLILPDRVADPSDDAIVLRASCNRAGMAWMRGDEAAFGHGEAGVARDKRQRCAARGRGEDAAIATDPDIGAIIGNTDDVDISMHAPPDVKLASALGVRLLAARKPKRNCQPPARR